MIQLNDIHKTYHGPSNDIHILNGISISVTPNCTISIIGPSGSGKSTLLRIIAGLEQPTKGRVIINNQNIYELTDNERASL